MSSRYSTLAYVSLMACGGAPLGVLGQSSSQTTCAWPVGADTYQASTHVGCKPTPTFDICEVPNGTIAEADGGFILADGGVGSANCTDACSSTEYALSCFSGGASASARIPDPAPALACNSIPIPTPSGALFYCCPCAR